MAPIQEARLARAAWAAGSLTGDAALRAVNAALQSGDIVTARWLLMRTAAGTATSASAGLVRALLARIEASGAHSPPSHPEAPGSLTLAGDAVAIRLASDTGDRPLLIEVDGRFSRIAPPASGGATARELRFPPPPGARVIRGVLGGRPLAGSPLVLRHDPEPCPPAAHAVGAGAAMGTAATTATTAAMPVVIVPVHGAAHAVRRCLQSLLSAHNRMHCRILVIDDASPDPALIAWLDEKARTGAIELLRRPLNGGFVAAVNSGLRHVGAVDVVLLNSDTVVTDGWLDRLRAAAHAAPDIGAANPLSNNAELLSVPLAMHAGPMPGPALQRRIDTELSARHPDRTVDIPAGVGFCWYLRGEALASVGLLDDAMVKAGYGEDTEFSLRLRRAGWRLVAALDTFVAHEGSRSFGAARQPLAARNVALMGQRFPEHADEYRRFLGANPLDAVARELQHALLAQGIARGQTLLLTDATCRERRRLCDPAPAWALTPQWQHGRLERVCLHADGVAGMARLGYAWPAQRDALLSDLDAAGFESLVRETFADWSPELVAALAGVGTRQAARLVDASAYCPRRYASQQPRAHCDEPPALADCEACVARHGALQRGTGPLDAWRETTRAALARAPNLRAGSAELARRLQARLGRKVTAPRARRVAGSGLKARRIAFVGVLDFGHGFAMLTDLARAIDRAGTDTRLVVIGPGFDERRLARHECVELPGDAGGSGLEDMLKRLDCDAVADPGFGSDGHADTLATRAGLPVLHRPELEAMIALLTGAST